MANRRDILIIIPHGGDQVPEELAGIVAASPFDIFYQSDTAANQVFAFGDRVLGTVDACISRLFVNLDRHYQEIPPREDGVMRRKTLFGKELFADGAFPDDIAMANILRRYWSPFHETVNRIVEESAVKLIIECHTMMAVGPPGVHDAGKPRPLVRVDHRFDDEGRVRKAGSENLAQILLESMERSLAGLEKSAAGVTALGSEPRRSYIMKEYGNRGIPLLRLSLSKGLFLTEHYFRIDELTVDPLRLRQIRDLLWDGIDRFYRKYTT